MTETEYKQIQEVFKPIRTIDEAQRINKDIAEINSILSTFPFNMVAARQKIKSINEEHLDNRLFYLLSHQPPLQVVVCSGPPRGLCCLHA